MASLTYFPIATQTTTSTVSSVTFSSISQAYTDLIIVVNNGSTVSAQGLFMQINGDTGSNYSLTTTWLNGNTSAQGNFQPTSTTGISQFSGLAQNATTIIEAMVINLMNYSNTTNYKTLIQRSVCDATLQYLVGNWHNNNAITSLTFSIGSGNIQTGSSFTIYGIKAA